MHEYMGLFMTFAVLDCDVLYCGLIALLGGFDGCVDVDFSRVASLRFADGEYYKETVHF